MPLSVPCKYHYGTVCILYNLFYNTRHSNCSLLLPKPLTSLPHLTQRAVGYFGQVVSQSAQSDLHLPVNFCKQNYIHFNVICHDEQFCITAFWDECILCAKFQFNAKTIILCLTMEHNREDFQKIHSFFP